MNRAEWMMGGKRCQLMDMAGFSNRSGSGCCRDYWWWGKHLSHLHLQQCVTNRPCVGQSPNSKSESRQPSIIRNVIVSGGAEVSDGRQGGSCPRDGQQRYDVNEQRSAVQGGAAGGRWWRILGVVWHHKSGADNWRAGYWNQKKYFTMNFFCNQRCDGLNH